MKKTRRWCAVLAVLLTVALAFTMASCSNSNDDDSSSSGTESDKDSSSTPTDSELAGYTYFYQNMIGTYAYAFDGNETAYEWQWSDTDTSMTIAQSLSKCFSSEEYEESHGLIKGTYTFTKVEGAEDEEGIYDIKGLLSGTYLSINKNSKIYLYYYDLMNPATAANYTTLRNSLEDSQLNGSGAYKVSSTFTKSTNLGTKQGGDIRPAFIIHFWRNRHDGR